MNEEDEIIEIKNNNYSLRRILGDVGYQKYMNANDKVRSAVKLKVTLDLIQIENTFNRLNEK